MEDALTERQKEGPTKTVVKLHSANKGLGVLDSCFAKGDDQTDWIRTDSRNYAPSTYVIRLHQRCILQRARQRPYRRLTVLFLSTDVALRFPRHACHGAGGLSHSPPTPLGGFMALVAEVAQPNPLHPGRRSELRQTSFWGTPILSTRDPICAANEHIPAISARRDPAIGGATRQKGSYVSRFLISWAPDHRRLSRPPRSVSRKHRQSFRHLPPVLVRKSGHQIPTIFNQSQISPVHVRDLFRPSAAHFIC